METRKKMERKLIDITLPRMEDKSKSLNTQKDKGTLIKLWDSWITQELRRITLTKIDEIKLIYFLNKTQLAFNLYRVQLITKDTKISITTHLKLLINDPLKLIMIHYLMVDCNWI